MLLGQMLREMRSAARWNEDENEGDSTFGADTLLETLDVELARHMAKLGGFGAGAELLKHLTRAQGAGPVSAAPVQGDPTVGRPSVAAPTAPLESPRAGGPKVLVDRVTSEYGWRQDPLDGAPRFHKGLDLAAAYGDTVHTVAPGRVVFEGVQKGYGQTVVIEHADGARSRYAHLSSAAVQVGELVTEGQVIARAGKSGRATGTHVHFEVTSSSGQPLDPRAWLAGVQQG